jgi:uncharacterized lipoprotein NlpE involved in copper resistance
MKKNIHFCSIFWTALLLFSLNACRSTQSTHVDTHNSRISVDWEGVYAGIIPAADGPGIDVHIALNFDETFELHYEYLDKPGHGFTAKGAFSWDDTGNFITLDIRGVPPYYKVGENLLIQLDMEGRTITGKLADNYVLRKI